MSTKWNLCCMPSCSGTSFGTNGELAVMLALSATAFPPSLLMASFEVSGTMEQFSRRMLHVRKEKHHNPVRTCVSSALVK